MSIRVILADDHVLMRTGLSGLIATIPNYEVVAQTNNGRDAVRLVQEIEPDLVLMDITMPRLNGIEATRQIVAHDPAVKVIGLSVHAERHFAEKMIGAGARAFLRKDCDSQELRTALEAVMDGLYFISPTILGSRMTLRHFVKSALTQPGGPKLSSKEQEILQLVAEGKTTREIAESVNLSAKSVEKYRQNLGAKLGIDSLAGLIKFALEEGYVSK